jgi:hypothetical protein
MATQFKTTDLKKQEKYFYFNTPELWDLMYADKDLPVPV